MEREIGIRIDGRTECIFIRVEENSALVIVACTAVGHKREDVGTDRAFELKWHDSKIDNLFSHAISHTRIHPSSPAVANTPSNPSRPQKLTALASCTP